MRGATGTGCGVVTGCGAGAGTGCGASAGTRFDDFGGRGILFSVLSQGRKLSTFTPDRGFIHIPTYKTLFTSPLTGGRGCINIPTYWDFIHIPTERSFIHCLACRAFRGCWEICVSLPGSKLSVPRLG